MGVDFGRKLLHNVDVKRLQARDVKIALRNGDARILDPPDIDTLPLSAFKRVRIRTGVEAFMEFVRGRGVKTIAEERGVTHQRASQIVNLGLDFLVARRCILVKSGPRKKFRAA